MKFLIDNNLSFKLVLPLQTAFPGTLHLRDVLPLDADDLSVWNFARANDFTLLTKDNDFDERVQLNGCPPKLVHLVCGNKPTIYILNLILLRNEKIVEFIADENEDCILKIS
jgi:predicted nuclease of predicted toxin-antitoxin system